MKYSDWLKGAVIAVKSVNNDWTRPVTYELKKLNIIDSKDYYDFCLDPQYEELRTSLVAFWKLWAKHRVYEKLKVDRS